MKMKKLICLILTVLLAAGCAASLAENAGETTGFLKIRDGAAAPVYRQPGEGTPVDTLPGGSFCGLIEETVKAGTVWYHVFYLDSTKKGATGYIMAENAELLSGDELKALMADTGTANDIMDLIDALDDYLKAGERELAQAKSAIAIPSAIRKPTAYKTLEKIYNYGMTLLNRLLSADTRSKLGQAVEKGIEKAGEVLTTGIAAAGEVLTTGMAVAGEVWEAGKAGTEKALEAGKAIAGEVLEAGKTAAETVKDGTKKLLEDAGEAAAKKLEELLPKAEEKLGQLADKASETIEYLTNGEGKEKLNNLMDKVKNTVDSFKEGAGEKIRDLRENGRKVLEKLDQFAGEETGKALSKLADETQNLLDSTAVKNTPAFLKGIGGLFTTEKFSGGVQSIFNFIDLYEKLTSSGN